ncbi:uncharacterized protein tmem79a [Aulostomus maculatus]
MSGQVGLFSEVSDEVSLIPLGPVAEPQIPGQKEHHESDSLEKGKTFEDEEELKEEDPEKEEPGFALLEPSTLPWPGDKDKRPQTNPDDGIRSEVGLSKPEERDTGISGGSQDLSEEPSQGESDRESSAKWRESLPEGERWRDDVIEMQQGDKGDGSLADDEEEEEEEEKLLSAKAAMGFTPKVTIVRTSSEEPPEESMFFMDDINKEPGMKPESPRQYYTDWADQQEKYNMCDRVCSEKVKLALATVAAGLLFPLLVWGGYALLPFDSPLLESTPLRVVYTLRCSFFATIPILLGVVVQGVARLRYGVLTPLYHSELLVNREVAVHWHYVNESLALFLFYFLQLAVMATYISQDLVKLVPLLTIIFVFGRLIYWLCLSLGSSIRGLGFGFSFFPILVMLGTNLYYICSTIGQEAVFDVEPPTTAPPPPKQLWWG